MRAVGAWAHPRFGADSVGAFLRSLVDTAARERADLRQLAPGRSIFLLFQLCLGGGPPRLLLQRHHLGGKLHCGLGFARVVGLLPLFAERGQPFDGALLLRRLFRLRSFLCFGVGRRRFQLRFAGFELLGNLQAFLGRLRRGHRLTLLLNRLSLKGGDTAELLRQRDRRLRGLRSFLLRRSDVAVFFDTKQAGRAHRPSAAGLRRGLLVDCRLLARLQRCARFLAQLVRVGGVLLFLQPLLLQLLALGNLLAALDVTSARADGTGQGRAANEVLEVLVAGVGVGDVQPGLRALQHGLGRLGGAFLGH